MPIVLINETAAGHLSVHRSLVSDIPTMPQNRPLSASGKLFRRFYEPLVLLSVLDRTRGAQRPDQTLDRGLDDMSKLWRNFLDQLSMLCDFEKGGDTVTAIGVQATPEHSVFWLASNSDHREKAREFLIWVLSRLQTAITNSTEDVFLEQELMPQCIASNYAKIKTYARILRLKIDECQDAIQTRDNPEDTIVLQELLQLRRLLGDHHQLCQHAYSIHQSKFMDILHKRHHSEAGIGLWSNLRHYIGRLGAMIRAVRIVRLAASKFPQHIENAQVEVVAPCVHVHRPSVEYTEGLAAIVRRMLPANENTLKRELTEALMEIEVTAGIYDKFCKVYTGMNPRPHAELLVLEHFYHQKLDFVSNNKYIGCSKPSCYCCNMYMQCHPGQFALRPSHGNLWVNWAPPIPLPLTSGDSIGAAPQTRVQDHHTHKMMLAMIDRIRLDIREQIISRRPKRQPLPDSTTGISTVAHEVEAALGDVLLGHARQGDDHNAALDSVDAPNGTPRDETVRSGVSTRDSLGDADSGSSRSDLAEDGSDAQDDYNAGSTTGFPDPENSQFSNRDRQVSSDEDDDGGVLLFAGRNLAMSR